MKIGDRVRFLNEVGGGTIAGFPSKKTVLVTDESGFDIPVLVTDVVLPRRNLKNNLKLNNPMRIFTVTTMRKKRTIDRSPFAHALWNAAEQMFSISSWLSLLLKV